MAYALNEGVSPTAEKKEERNKEQRASHLARARIERNSGRSEKRKELVASNWPNRQDHVELQDYKSVVVVVVVVVDGDEPEMQGSVDV